jgi:SLBB domain
LDVGRALAAAVLCAAALLTPRQAFACQCFVTTEHKTAAQRTDEVRRELQKALAVFSGEVIGRNALSVRFKVDAVWKGDIPAEFAMSNGAVAEGRGLLISSCDFSFRIGARYVVFAYGKNVQDMKATSCTLTTSMPDGTDTVMFLDTLALGRRPTGLNSKHTIAVFGAVARQGLVEWTEGMTVADAMARAGGYAAPPEKTTEDVDARSVITRYPGEVFARVDGVTHTMRLLVNDSLWVGRDLK